ncbi:amidase hydantoinase/carbamoylase [Punctularia strigosozonata HHB-11173 SS5]|uniref:Amidase hydantoinase/carbamoylase n=1 Tax=Punctularia strigosozonata (strain HHB-11173) TaxID=741275 RepID=R7S1J5_PUNST|nr:amidase hydantoinase/carbamoylase [Punctularia strigosozonata HHB-11173 SS5]EIN04103.1 amidase hydantoinase/carbamoylase [Punctularia strigosozonata HHB-11173 SS5]
MLRSRSAALAYSGARAAPRSWASRVIVRGDLGRRARFLSAAAGNAVSVNADRLNRTIHETCRWGEAHRFGPDPTETGMCRLALTDSDAEARRWFVDEMKAQGCKVSVDQMGNIFAVRKGRKEGAPTAMGSHLDTQPSGGRYDGILGIISGVEAVRTLNEHNIETEYPVAVVNWTNEEGARFPQSVVSSSVYAGSTPLADAWALADIADASKTMKSELERIGFLGSVPCSFDANPIAAHFELHIEQGPILEKAKAKVGVVTGGQGYRWYDVQVSGRAAHSGSTPFYSRSDALLCAARIIAKSNEIAKEHRALATTGILTLEPGSTNVIPSSVRFTLDVRHPDIKPDTLDAVERDLIDATFEIALKESELGCDVNWKRTSVANAVQFPPAGVECVKEAGVAVVGEKKVLEIVSGAGHDSCAVSYRCPTSMVFVPSKDGLSHNPREYTSPEDCAIGAQVLLNAVLAYDRRRAAGLV